MVSDAILLSFLQHSPPLSVFDEDNSVWEFVDMMRCQPWLSVNRIVDFIF